jgi:hypothetical protein
VSLTLVVWPGRLAVCRLSADAAIPEWADGPGLCSITRTPGELSVVCDEERVPAGARCEIGWRGLEVRGPLDMSQIGVLSSIAEPLAREGVGLLAISTYDTDWILVRETDLDRATASLSSAGHRVEGS